MGQDVETATCFFPKFDMIIGITNDEALLCSGIDASAVRAQAQILRPVD